MEIKQFLFAVYLSPFMELTNIFWVFILFGFIVLPGFLCNSLIHASYVARIQNIYTFPRFYVYQRSTPLLEFFMLLVLVGINLCSYQLLSKTVVLNTL